LLPSVSAALTAVDSSASAEHTQERWFVVEGHLLATRLVSSKT